jgi:hypothetical protein
MFGMVSAVDAILSIFQAGSLTTCDSHAPLFWDSEPSAKFAHTPLPNSRITTLSPNSCFQVNFILALLVEHPISEWPERSQAYVTFKSSCYVGRRRSQMDRCYAGLVPGGYHAIRSVFAIGGGHAVLKTMRSVSGHDYDCDDNGCRDQRKDAIECFRSGLCGSVGRRHGLCWRLWFANEPANISRLHWI